MLFAFHRKVKFEKAHLLAHNCRSASIPTTEGAPAATGRGGASHVRARPISARVLWTHPHGSPGTKPHHVTPFNVTLNTMHRDC